MRSPTAAAIAPGLLGFAAPGLAQEGSFKAAEARYRLAAEIDPVALDLWLAEARVVQYDYKNIMRNRGRLDRLV
jgi:hypothetical protein